VPRSSLDRLVEISRLLSLMLRHEPAKFALTLDAEGFAPIEDVLTALQSRLPDTTADDIRTVVATIEPDKRRFSIEDGDIRANYGHSLAERIAQQKAAPPALLLHGTTEPAALRILEEGLTPMRRQYVHMTVNRELALRVGARRGKPVLLAVDAAAAHDGGVAFYRANESFWLADSVPAIFIRRA
jgi:putative RNA 2'-phosphotransferase